MKGILHKTEQGWVVNYPKKTTTPGNPKSLGSYKRTTLRSEIPIHPDYVKYYFLDEDAEGGEVEFEIVRYCKKHNSDPSKNSVCTLDCGYDEVSYAKLINQVRKLDNDKEKELFELEQQLDIPSHMRWHNRESKETLYTEEQTNEKINLAIKEFERLKSKAKSLKDVLYLDGVLAVLEGIKNQSLKQTN